MLGDPIAIMHQYLSDQLPLMDLCSGGIYSPRLPSTKSPPALAFFIRGGTSNPHIPPTPSPSFQFDCLADDPREAYKIYRELYDTIQGLQNETVTVAGTDYRIMSVVEEVQGQQIQPVDPKDYHRVLGLFQVTMEV